MGSHETLGVATIYVDSPTCTNTRREQRLKLVCILIDLTCYQCDKSWKGFLGEKLAINAQVYSSQYTAHVAPNASYLPGMCIEPIKNQHASSTRLAWSDVRVNTLLPFQQEYLSACYTGV